MSEITVNEIIELREIAAKAGFARPALGYKYPPEEIIEKKIFNGIGPDWVPDWVREELTKLLPSLKASAFDHDIKYFEGGTIEEFHQANDELRTDGYKEAKYRWGWYNPRRYIAMNNARIAAKLCDEFGLKGWKLKEAQA